MAIKTRIFIFLTCCLLVPGFIFAFTPTLVFAQSRPALLLDAELDDYINTLATPLLLKAGLSPDNVHVLILNDPSINAFVNSQSTIFVMSGLILHAEAEGEVAGVLAHEIGHLKGHHLLRLAQEASTFSFPALVGGILGIGAVAAGAPDAGVALLAGGQAAGISAFLKFSRSQEQQADQIAVTLLEKTDHSTQGLKNFFNRLRTYTLLYHREPPAYLQTHPRSQERQNFIESLPATPTVEKPQNKLNFARIQAKLYALTHSPAQTQRKFLYEDAPSAAYALSIAAFLNNNFTDVTTFLNKTTFHKTDPYVLELNAHMALNKGDLPQALNLFEKALQQKQTSPILRFYYGRTLRLTMHLKEAIAQFETILQKHPEWSSPHQEIGLAYGELGLLAHSHIALAKAALYRNNTKDATYHLALATQYLKDLPENKRKFKEDDIKLLQQELEK